MSKIRINKYNTRSSKNIIVGTRRKKYRTVGINRKISMTIKTHSMDMNKSTFMAIKTNTMSTDMKGITAMDMDMQSLELHKCKENGNIMKHTFPVK
jgi:hypothetical protein